MPYNDQYVVIRTNIFLPLSANESTQIVLTPQNSGVIEVVRAWASQDNDTIEFQATVEIGIVENHDITETGASHTPQKLRYGSDATNTSCQFDVPEAGVDRENDVDKVLLRKSFHSRNGFLYIPLKEERIRFLSSGGSSESDHLYFTFEDPMPEAKNNWTMGLIYKELT